MWRRPTVDVDGTEIDISAACAALAPWDGTYTLDAVGAIVFREWLAGSATSTAPTPGGSSPTRSTRPTVSGFDT